MQIFISSPMKSATSHLYIPQITHHLFTFFMCIITCLCMHTMYISIYTSRSPSQCNSSVCIEIMESPNVLTETLRILRYNSITFMAIGALLICPVSAIHLSNILIDQSLVKRVTLQLLLIAKSSGLPLNPFVKQCCHEFSEMVISGIVCFPLYITLLLISKAAVVYSVECTYSQKKSDSYKFYVIMKTIWRRVFSTYLLICVVIIGCITLLIMLLICVSNLLFVFGLSSNLIAYIAIAIGLFFSLFLAHTLIVCDISMVISVLEDVSGPQALLRSSVLIRGQTQVGLIIFLGSTIGMAVVKGLFEYLMKSLGYGDKGSRIWERPVLVVIYSFLVLIDFLMSTVFYFSCKSCSLEASNVECKSVLENVSSPLGSLD